MAGKLKLNFYVTFLLCNKKITVQLKNTLSDDESETDDNNSSEESENENDGKRATLRGQKMQQVLALVGVYFIETTLIEPISNLFLRTIQALFRDRKAGV